ncbi:hypothetical protein [Dyadobacter arcticus]|uniref:DUF3575 domain-containing protein n=1 Tax=Dyadobacter arcticus TaxID=1078754 RepID=A0ABX0UKL0_9BACT|nr:hypothetical protein [Dyadobacter arcticus]NIJ53442.1 hypothetical protein [Dyadobacter arcticus]
MFSCIKPILLCAFLFQITLTHAQRPASNGNFQKKVNAFIDKKIERFPWEVNFNMAPVLYKPMSGWITYKYIIKRNVGKGGKTGAWRFSLSPSFLGKTENIHPDTTLKFSNKRTNFFRPRLEFGYEWQKVKGRFILFYGISSFYAIEFESNKSDDHFYPLGVPAPPRGKYEYMFRRNYFSVAPLIGAKCYLNAHFSISLESQLQTTYFWDKSSTYFNDAFLQKDFVYDLSILPYPVYALNLACHF